MKLRSTWYSPRLERDITLVRWGVVGTPVLLFPTAGGDAEEMERFLMIDALSGLLEAGRIKIYSVDSIAGRTWVDQHHDPLHCAWVQNQFDACLYHEVLPAIRSDCHSHDIELITAGASIGAFNALATLCRHPDAVRAAICMSGSFDFEKWLGGHAPMDFYYSSPLHFLPNLNGGGQLELLRHRFALLAFGQGRWESPDQSWRMAAVLGDKGIPNRVDAWGHDHDHDWPTWRAMLPQYLDWLA